MAITTRFPRLSMEMELVTMAGCASTDGVRLTTWSPLETPLRERRLATGGITETIKSRSREVIEASWLSMVSTALT